MEMFLWIILLSQLIFTLIAGLYFYNGLKSQPNAKDTIFADAQKELEKMRRLREIKLTEPLSEVTRPGRAHEIIGQEVGLKALKNALCSPNPQHVILYGPPGVGKTAAARVMLEEAKAIPSSPFTERSPFIELDATILQFDERSIADPLIGSVHDPIYHGAGVYGQAGIPQVKPGAVTKAHGGILFIDEIGELHNAQMNKLLKVLEDRSVTLSSSYYSKSNKNIPKHIHDVFENGLPADFRLIGATTRKPEELPPALRSRCKEIFFRPLNKEQMKSIARNAIKKTGISGTEEICRAIAGISQNGRDAVNIAQSAISMAEMANRNFLSIQDIDEIIETGHYVKACAGKRDGTARQQVGYAKASIMDSSGTAAVIGIEAAALKSFGGLPSVFIGGVAETEEVNLAGRRLLKKSAAACAVYNALAVLKNVHQIDPTDYDIHVNFSFPSQADTLSIGESVGCAVFSAIYSSIMHLPIPADGALTGRLGLDGKIGAVNGLEWKLSAARDEGLVKLFIPEDQLEETTGKDGFTVIRLSNTHELINALFNGNESAVGEYEGPGLKVLKGPFGQAEQGDS